MKDSSYSKEGSFPVFLQQTNEKKVEAEFIISQLKEKYDFKKYHSFTFTDIGAGDGILTAKIAKFLLKKADTEIYCVEPSNMIETLKERFKKIPNAHLIQKGAEETILPMSDFMLLSHAMGYIKDRKSFAKFLAGAVMEKGKILFVGTAHDSDDLKLMKSLNPKKSEEHKQKKKENIFDYFEELGFKVSREFCSTEISMKNAIKANPRGKGLMSFYYKKPVEDLTPEEISMFVDKAKELASKGKLTKRIQFIWVER